MLYYRIPGFWVVLHNALRFWGPGTERERTQKSQSIMQNYSKSAKYTRHSQNPVEIVSRNSCHTDPYDKNSRTRFLPDLSDVPRNLLYCIVLCCIVLYCIVLYCIVLYYIVLYCIVLCCIVLSCFVLYCIVLYCIMLYRISQCIAP